MIGALFVSHRYRFVISPMLWNSMAILKPHSVVVEFDKAIGLPGAGEPTGSFDAFHLWCRSSWLNFSPQSMGRERDVSRLVPWLRTLKLVGS